MSPESRGRRPRPCLMARQDQSDIRAPGSRARAMRCKGQWYNRDLGLLLAPQVRAQPSLYPSSPLYGDMGGFAGLCRGAPPPLGLNTQHAAVPRTAHFLSENREGS